MEGNNNYESDQNVLYTGGDEATNISALNLRLNTESYLIKIENFLRGVHVRQVFDEEKQAWVIVQEKTRKRATEEGINYILEVVSSVINPHVAQGNFTLDMYKDYVFFLRTEFACILMDNLYNWGIREEDYNAIIFTFISFAKAYVTRPISNKERESLSSSTQIREVNTVNPNEKKGFFRF